MTRLLILACALCAGCTAPGLPSPDPEPGVRADSSSPAVEAALPPRLEPVLTRIEPEAPAPAPDLWDRLRAGYDLPRVDHPRVSSQLRWYASHQAYLDRVVERGRPYLHHIVSEIERRGLPMELALLPIVESAFDPFAYSHGRAAGLWQFIPGTGRMYALDQDWWHDERRDVLESTRAALDHLEDLHRTFDGDWLLALAAYNSGSGNVRRALRRNRAAGRPTGFFALDLPRETEAYVPKLVAIATLVADPAAHGTTLPGVADTPGFRVVETGGQVDLARAAELAGISGRELYRLNPALNRWATHPEGPHRLLVPPERAPALAEGLATLAPEDRITWKRHRIRPGETLSTIAVAHHTSIETLRRANRIRGSSIRAGDALLIPVASAPAETYALSSEQRQQQRDERNAEGRGEPVRYRVRRGDSFWRVARRHGVDMHRLASWNGMAIRDPLRAGQELVIWKAAPVTAATSPPGRETVTRKLGYRVRSGDSLSRIAARFGVSIDQIISWNTLNPARYLQPGQRLTLFVDVTGG
jgi:membrane-bound lytic murein transglycosylase D